MSKQYIFYKKDVINLLLNHKSYISKKAKEAMALGRDITKITIEETTQWTEQFFQEEIERGAVQLEDILDDVDEILKRTMGKTTLEVVEEKKLNIN